MPRRAPTAWIALAAIAISLVGAGGAEPAEAAERLVIGHSVRGRPIPALVLGDPAAPERVVVIGCVHGDETAGIRVARRLIAAGPAPNAALWVVPSLNPDGVATGTRGNARGVDLNRNFPLDWRPLGGLEYAGPRPLSEPESRAARGLIRRIDPDLTLWFHQPFGVVDRSGGDPAIERRFAELIGLPLVRLERPPGSASSWQNQARPRSSAFVVELPRVAGGRLVGRAARAVRTLARQNGSLDVGAAAAVAKGKS